MLVLLSAKLALGLSHPSHAQPHDHSTHTPIAALPYRNQTLCGLSHLLVTDLERRIRDLFDEKAAARRQRVAIDDLRGRFHHSSVPSYSFRMPGGWTFDEYESSDEDGRRAELRGAVDALAEIGRAHV